MHVDAAEDAGDRGVGGVAAGADPHQAVQVRELGGVEDRPAAADEALEAGVEVRRIELVGVAGEIARRDVQRPAQRDAEVREVAAHAGALRHGVEGRGHRVGGAAQVLDVVVDPVADRDDLLVRVLDRAEQVPGQPAEPIGLAVAAREQVRDGRRAQLGDRRRLDGAGAVGLEVAVDRRRVVRAPRSCVARSPAGGSGCRSPSVNSATLTLGSTENCSSRITCEALRCAWMFRISVDGNLATYSSSAETRNSMVAELTANAVPAV